MVIYLRISSIFNRRKICFCQVLNALLNAHVVDNVRQTEMHTTGSLYEGRLKSSWTHLITPSLNFVEVRWRSLFRSTSLGKRYTSHNASLLQNLLQTVDPFETYCLGAPFAWLEMLRNRMGRDLDCMVDILMGFHRSTFSKPNTELNSDLAPCDFCFFLSTMKRELRGKELWSNQRSAARFREVDAAL
jgi:hypothetical protein